jgi:Tfp pilus assembly protein PilV
MFNKLSFKNQNGIGLIEVVVALGISIIIVTSIVSLSIYSLRSSTQSKYMLEGTKLAGQELELLRASRDKKKWTAFRNSVCPSCIGSQCHVTDGLDINAGQQSITTTNGNIVRYFTVNSFDGDCSDDQVLRFSVTVTWPSGGSKGTSSTYTYTDLSNWVGE